MQKIATVSVTGSTQASLDFTSIPGTYTDLVILLSGRSNTAVVNDSLFMTINSSTASFTYRLVGGTGSATNALNGSTNFVGYVVGSSATASVFGNAVINVQNYASAVNKAMTIQTTVENNAAAGYPSLVASLWSNTATITSISLTNGGSWVQYTTATLYGVLKGSDGITTVA